jgi:preprotein translocase subunit SecF
MLEIPNAASALVSFTMQPAYVGANSFTSADAVIAGINDELIGDGLTIASKDLGFSAYSAALTGQVSGTLQILNQSGQELDDTDLQAQFNDAAAQEGMQVTAFGVQQVTNPSGVPSGTNSGTGSQGTVITTGVGNAPGGVANTPTVHVCGDPSWGFIDDPVQFISCMTSKALTTTGILAIGLLIGVVLIVGFQQQRRVSPV